MLALPIHRGCGRLLVALAFTGLAFPAWVATGRMAWAQKISPPPDTEIEQLFREYQRLTRLEPRRVEPVPGGWGLRRATAVVAACWCHQAYPALKGSHAPCSASCRTTPIVHVLSSAPA